MVAVREEHTALRLVVGGHRDRYVGSTLRNNKRNTTVMGVLSFYIKTGGPQMHWPSSKRRDGFADQHAGQSLWRKT